MEVCRILSHIARRQKLVDQLRLVPRGGQCMELTLRVHVCSIYLGGKGVPYSSVRARNMPYRYMDP